MKILLFVELGGFVGSSLRFIISETIKTKSVGTFSYGMLSVNVIGCLVIGLSFVIVRKASFLLELRYSLATGQIGGFTAFSTFSYETFSLIRAGQMGYAAVYVLMSILLGVMATFLGVWPFRFL